MPSLLKIFLTLPKKFSLVKSFRTYFLLSFFLLVSCIAFAQRSKDGAKIVSTANNIVNEYTTLTANAAAGASTITVANSTLNTNGRFPGALAPGDLIMIIQMQGATILGAPDLFTPGIGFPYDSTWGAITNYNEAGNNEFAEVYSIPNGTSITLDCPLINNYTSAGRVVVVRVPRYSSLTVNAGGSLTCDTWLGSIGGVCAIEVENNTTINAGGSIDVTGKGFRGAQLLENQTNFGLVFSASTFPQDGAEKGEGIAGYQNDYTANGGMYMRGAPANGGGGGNAHNAGGGGGANGGNPLLWNGHGMPDNSIAGWTAAWNLQYAGFAAQISTGGGQGGYSCSDDNQDATITGPNNGAWLCDQRRSNGGFGGRPLDYSTGRLFLGGGGGSGDQNDNWGGRGGNGGAMIYLMNYGTVSGAGQIISNGNNGVNTSGTPAVNGTAGRDGAGGAGAGGTIIVNSVGTISGISITANGGNGGNQAITKGAFFFGAENEAEGPGGGGSGGYIAISNGAPIRTANGGANGTTNSDGLTEFLPNGATQGGAGTNNAAVTNFIINAPNVTICAGQSATLTATLSGTVPGGTTIIWYDQLVAGNVLGNGSPYITPVLAAGTYTYYVGTCPGTYHQPVIVTVTLGPAVSAGSDATICSGANTTLNASGGTGYVWSPTTGLSNPNISNPVANPVSTTTYIVTVTTSCGNANDTVIVNVNSSITASISGNTTICAGGNTTLTASGGGNYSWTTGATTSSINVSPTTTSTYSVFVGSGSCADTASATVVVSSGITASITGNTTICPGSATTLTASGGSSYSWSTTATTASITVSPTSTSTYSVIASSGSCADTTSITITVSNNITASVTGATTICAGGNSTLSASGGNNYSWNTTQTTSSITVSPTSTTNYSVIVSSGTCADTTSITVTVASSITASISGNTTICSGNSTTLTANGGSNYSWTTSATTSSITVAPTSTTNYSVIVSSGSCADTAGVTVTVNPGVAASISGNTLLCTGDATTLTASGGGNYSWTTGATTSSITVTPASSTTYSVIASNGSCADTASVTVTVSPPPTASISGNTTICSGQTTMLTASPAGNNYSWTTGATTSSISVSTAGTYSVIVSAGSCSNTASITLSVSPTPTASVSGNATLCPGNSATLSASGGGSYSWSNGQTSSSITASAAGTYSVIVSSGGCSDTAATTVIMNSNPTATVSPDITITQGQSTNLSASGGTTYTWNNGDNGASITVSPNSTTDYCVTVYDANNCQDTACVKVIVELCSTAGTLFLPNAFSPNGDGENDSLQIYYGNHACIKTLYLVIYNRWGEKVFETDKSDFKWDGKYEGVMNTGKRTGDTEALPYYMDAEIVDGTLISKKGNISLMR